MAAVLRDLGPLRDVVCALSIARSTSHKHDFDGQREPVRNRCLACLPTLALAASAQPKVLLDSNPVCVGVLNSLEYFGLFARLDAPWKYPRAGFLEIPCSRLAAADGRLAIWAVRRGV